ncbi:cupin domain-containing protein [Sphingomonas xanthus]|uniref:Cupin domain-containing protein n=1 Tax=Sphingomonas xanthus TaxID=2594473 RepID=A0A516IR34_9SPHN|nr:cupin domain-containing protein [Sphingomonas xanthus]QDP19358.1 cupin domain-containing protein [Sphingomonas xanthus]
MKKFEGSRFTSEKPWGGPNVARLADALVKLRWTDQPFRWHANKGTEIFVVLDGEVDMHVRSGGQPSRIIHLRTGDLLHIESGEEHVAHPRGEARILVVEEAEQ